MKKSLAKAHQEHEKFLKSLGLRTGRPLLKSQLRGVKMANLKIDTSNLAPTSDKIVHVSSKVSVVDPMNLQKESKATQEKIKEWSMRVAPAFNKGGYQVVTQEELKGNKRR